ncbi:MAG: hypothetical protein QOI09_966 [Chloroflexota bacterium]|nr:hypothetical protein [Chloroflexota bacterium]
MAERRPGLLQVLLVGALVVGLVAAAMVVTLVLPSVQYVVLRTPLLILVLIGGTAGVLWRITRPDHPDR